MQKLRRWLSISLIISMVFLLPMRVSAQTTPAQVNFVASSLDANNNFTVTMSISNATFNAFQFVLRYDTSKMYPIDKTTKLTAVSFNDFSDFNLQLNDYFASTSLRFNSQLGIIEFTNYVPGESYSYGAEVVDKAASIGSTSVQFYTFYFHLLSREEPIFELAKVDLNKPYNETLPDGWGIALGNQRVTAKVVIDLSKISGNIKNEEYLSPPITQEPQNTDSSSTSKEQSSSNRPVTSKQRLENTLVMQIGNYAAAKDGELCHIYFGEKSVFPYIKDQRTFVPIRFIAEKLGLKVTWDDITKTVGFQKGEDILTLVIGEKAFNKNDIRYEMDTGAELYWNRTMVPVRFVAEALGYAVEWNEKLNLVFITEKDQPWLLEDPIEQLASSEVVLIISPLIRDFYVEEET